MSDLIEKEKSSSVIYDGKILHVYKDTVTLPNGEEACRELIRHVGAVAIVALTDDGRVILERQFRYPLGKSSPKYRQANSIPKAKTDLREPKGNSSKKRDTPLTNGYRSATIIPQPLIPTRE